MRFVRTIYLCNFMCDCEAEKQGLELASRLALENNALDREKLIKSHQSDLLSTKKELGKLNRA